MVAVVVVVMVVCVWGVGWGGTTYLRVLDRFCEDGGLKTGTQNGRFTCIPFTALFVQNIPPIKQFWYCTYVVFLSKREVCACSLCVCVCVCVCVCPILS